MNELSIESKRRILGAIYSADRVRVTKYTAFVSDDEGEEELEPSFDANLALGECVPWIGKLKFSERDKLLTELESIVRRACDGRAVVWPYVLLWLKPEHIFSAMDSYLLTLKQAKP